jgi:hypothetical protein
MLQKSESARRFPAGRPRKTAPTCTPRSLCVRCAMVEIIGYRIRVFERTFGRKPKSNEPIFFAPNSPALLPAPRDEFRTQVSEAARRKAVALAPLLHMLKLD